MPDIYQAASSSSAPKAVVPGNQVYPEEVEKIRRQPTSNPLASFIAAPRDWRFETQESEEEIILILRRHWLTNFSWLLLGFILVPIPQIVYLFFDLQVFSFGQKIMAILVWYLFLSGFIFERFLNWFFNVFIVTDERIIDFDFHGLIYKEITDAKTEDIQDVTYRVGGFVRNLFNFGDVFVQTAAQVPQLEFLDVPQPGRVAKILRELITQEELERLAGRAR